MITRNNLPDVIGMINSKDRKRIANTDKEYAYVRLITFNAGSIVIVKMTDQYNRYKNSCNDGAMLMYSSELNELCEKYKEVKNDTEV